MKKITSILSICFIIFVCCHFMYIDPFYIWRPKPVSSRINLDIRMQRVKFYIHKIGNPDNIYIFKTKQILKNRFGIESEISDSIAVTGNIIDKSKKLNLKKLNIIEDYKPHIYITTMNLNNNNEEAWGVCNENKIFISTKSAFEHTLIHEFGHWNLLQHCKNDTCAMNISGISLKFCNTCNSKFNFLLSFQQQNAYYKSDRKN